MTMSVFSQKFKRSLKKAASWSLAALTALSCAASLPVITSRTVNAASSGVDLSNDARGVLYASSRSDFRDESIYFLITTRFYDGDPSNNEHCVDDTKAKNPDSDPAWRGDFKGLIDKLDYIKALGFTAIWITPVVQNRSSYDYHGYHAYDFTAVDTRYESNGITYQDLIDACHAKGMKVIQDVVFNHTCNWGEKNLCPIEIDVWSPNGRSDMPMPAGKSMDPDQIYHHFGYAGGGDWDNYNVQITTLHSDCFDLNTENPTVYNYLIDCYKKFVDMGVDAFRVDTVKHLSRLTLNKTIVPALQEEYKKVHSGSGYDNFYMFGEVCTKGESTWYRDQPPISTCFYTWADDDSWLSKWTTDPDTNIALTEEHYNAHSSTSNQPTSTNAFLNGNDYHTPDYSQRSGLDSIDFQMHWQFDSAGQAFGMAQAEDPYFNDSTWSVTYVNSHDYSPNNCQTIIPEFSEETWAEDLSLIFTFRGIPCIYYGTEIRFQHGKPIDVGPNAPLSETGRAYFGDNIEGTLTTTAPGVFDAADGTVKTTLESPLSQHLIRLNRLRQAIPALRKGQYSTEGISGNGMAFKRRYTDSNVDSFCCVTISGSATFSGIPNGTYVDAVTGDTQNVTGGTLTANCSGQGNLRVYVLSTAKTPAPGRVVPNGSFMGDGGSPVIINHESVSTVKPTDITLDKTSVTVLEEESVKVTATVTPKDAAATVSWSTSDPSVATVSGGVIKGVGKGTATITAKVTDSLKATVTVTVKENTNIVKPTGVSISPSTLSLAAGKTGTLTATVTPSNATDKTVTWSSSNESVATVSSGTVTAVGAGTATITATTSNGLKSTATVKVEGPKLTYIENGVYFEKPASWNSGINVYIYDGNTDTTIGAAWPGTAMKADGNNVYYYEFKPTASNVKVIFNDGGNQAPGSQMPGFDFENRGYYNTAGMQRIVEKEENVDVTAVSLNKTSATIKVGETVALSATVTPANATDPSITWSTSNASVATVSNGVVTGKSEGTVTITATSSNGKTATASVKVEKEDIVVTELTNKSTVSATAVNVGDTVTITGAASGGTTPYQFAYYYKKSSSSSYTTIKNYSTSKTATFTPAAATTYNVLIKVKDADGSVARKEYKVTASSDPTPTTLTNKSTVSATSITLGSSVTVTGTATGGTSPYKYQVSAKKASASTYTVLQDYSTTRTVKFTPKAETSYNLKVVVKDSAGKTAAKTFTVKVTPSVLTNKSTLSAASTTTTKGVTVTGAATGGTSPYEYAAYYKLSSASSYTLARSYSTTKTMTVKPAKAGTYTVLVKVRDSAGTVVSKTFTLTVKAGALTNTTKAAAASVQAGSSLKITGAATGGTSPYQYAAYYKLSSATDYKTLRSYSTTATMYFKPVTAGTYTIRTKVKDSKGTVSTKDLTIKVTPAPLANTSKIASTSVTAGSSVKITCAATGGTKPYQFAGYYKKSTATNFSEFRGYSTTATMYFKPAAAATYDVKIKVKDSAGSIVAKTFTVKATAASTAALANSSTISATSVALGKSVTVTGAATGGTSPYKYHVSYKKSSSDTYSVVQDYSTNKSVTIKPSTKTTYNVRVRVKDSTGTVAAKFFTLTVK